MARRKEQPATLAWSVIPIGHDHFLYTAFDKQCLQLHPSIGVLPLFLLTGKVTV